MNKKLQIFIAQLFAILFFLSFHSKIIAQNCTVNAGVDKTVCPGEPLILEGNIGGNFVPNTLVWSQISGPNTAIISNTTSISPTVTGVIAGVYVFQIQSTCTIGGNAVDQVTYTVKTGATGITPSNIALGCYTAGTSIPLTGTAPGGHSLNWSFSNSTEPTSGSFNGTGQTSVTGNNPSVSLSAPPTDWCTEGGTSTATINVTSTNISSGCSVTNNFRIFFDFNAGPVTATATQPVLCGPATPFKLNGSCHGAGTGLWTVVSQPGGSPVITFSPNNSTANVTPQNLIAGDYTFRWTVSGAACTTGSADVNISVGNGSTSVTDASAAGKTYCEGTLPSTFALEGNSQSVGETVLWTQISGAPVTIANPTSTITQASGLTEAGAPYVFKYTITSANGFCSKSATITVGVTKAVLWTPSPSSSCVFNAEVTRSVTMGSVPFMNAETIPVTMMYESGPVTNLQVNFNALMYQANGNFANVFHQSPTYNIVQGGTASYNYSATTLWPTNNQYSATFVFGFKTENNIPSCGNIVPGIYKFRIMYSDKCGSTVSQPFEVRINGVAAFNAGSDQMLPCSNTTTTLAGNVVRCDVQAFWTTMKKPTAAPDPIDATNKYNTNAPLNNLQVGSYIFKWSSSSVYEFCTVNSDSVRVTVALAPPVVPVVSAPATGCTNAPVNISGELNDDAIGGTWTVTSNPLGGTYTLSPSVNSPNIIFTPNTPNTIYTLTWTVSNGCGTTFASTTVTSNNTLAVMPDISNTSDCSFSNVFGTLTATPAGGVWTSSNPNYTLVSPNSISTTVTPNTIGEWWQTGPVTFYYTVTDACGTFADSVSYSRSNYPALTVGAFCSIASYPANQTITLTNLQQYGQYEIYDITGPGTASVTPQSFTASGLTQNLALTVSQSGQYTLLVRRKNGLCSEVLPILIRFSTQGGLALAGADISLCGATNSIALNGQPNPLGTDNGLWSLHTIYSGTAPTIANSTQPNSNITFANGGGDVLLEWKVMGDNPVCGAGTVDYVRVKYTPQADAGLDDMTCRGTSVPAGTVSYGLNANTAAPGTGLWTIVSQPGGSVAAFVNDTEPNTTVTALSDGAYVFRWTITNTPESCVTQDDVTLVITNGCGVLALDLGSFKVQASGKDIDVSWTVNAEEDEATYVVERAFSSQGPFGAINSQKQNNANNKHYSYKDLGAAELNVSNVYYRIKEISKTGKISYTNIEAVRLKKQNGINVYPTIVNKGEPINIAIKANDAPNYLLHVVAVTGQVISKTKINKTGITQISTAGLPSGAYILQLSGSVNSFAYKVIVK